MISKEDMDRLLELTRKFWLSEVKTDHFRGLFAGKEIGHRIADYVDETTTSMLTKEFKVVHELDAKGKPRARSMGDVWIFSEGMYNPVNVKAGEAGKNGQPNMVSLTKLLDALLDRQIDSYYLLIVKMRMSSVPASADVDERDLKPDQIVPNVYLVDMLDYLDFVTFDSGPGQSMLKEKQFYEFVDAGKSPRSTDLFQKVKKLIDLLEDGDRRLIENREKKMARIRASFLAYRSDGTHQVNQKGLNLG